MDNDLKNIEKLRDAQVDILSTKIKDYENLNSSLQKVVKELKVVLVFYPIRFLSHSFLNNKKMYCND